MSLRPMLLWPGTLQTSHRSCASAGSPTFLPSSTFGLWEANLLALRITRFYRKTIINDECATSGWVFQSVSGCWLEPIRLVTIDKDQIPQDPLLVRSNKDPWVDDWFSTDQFLLSHVGSMSVIGPFPRLARDDYYYAEHGGMGHIDIRSTPGWLPMYMYMWWCVYVHLKNVYVMVNAILQTQWYS